MKRVKIIVTTGPSIHNETTLSRLVSHGADVLRINANHGNTEQWEWFLRKWREINPNGPVALDLRGPSVRLTAVSKEFFGIGERVIIGQDIRTSIDLEPYLDEGDTILIDDGRIVLEVVRTHTDHLEAVVITGGRVSAGKSVNIPGTEIQFELPTPKDQRDIMWGVEKGVDLVFLSFVSYAEDVKSVKDFIEDKGGDLWVVSKIENRVGVDNADNIVKSSDGIMVARGDLGVELPLENLPLVQKMLVKKARRRGIPAIIATQLLSSMVNNPFPTRAEVSDVANAVMDGASALMLSNETSIGKYPVEAVDILNRIILSVEDQVPECVEPIKENEADHTSLAAHVLAKSVGARYIFLPTIEGITVRRLARFNPRYTIVAVTNSERMARKVQWIYATEVYVTDKDPYSEDAMEEVIDVYLKSGKLRKGEPVLWVDVRKEEQNLRVLRVGIKK